MRGAVEGLVGHCHCAYRVLQRYRAIIAGAFTRLMLSMLTTVVMCMLVPVRVLVLLISVHSIVTMVVRSAKQGHREAR